jgi:hypothetical protein
METLDPTDPTGSTRTAHSSHLLSGWASFLEHVHQAHGVEPPSDDAAALALHQELHAMADGSSP